MGRLIDEAAVVQKINHYLTTHDFKPRDADGNDFQYGHDTSLRFKTGTVYGEVSVQVYIDNKVAEVIRIIRNERVVEAQEQIDRIIKFHRYDVEEIFVDEREEPVAEVMTPRFVCKCGHPGAGCYCR